MILEGECGTFNTLLLECLTDIQDTLQEDLNAGGCNADTKQDEKLEQQMFQEILKIA